MELSNETKDKIVDIVNSAYGRNIGTSLQVDLEGKINSILPDGYQYFFTFNMSGGTKHEIYKGDKLEYEF